jgi:PilZ domain
MHILARPPRFKLNIPIQIEWGSTTLQGSVTSISANGLFIEMTNPLWAGATFLADLMVGPPLQMYCTVSRIDPSRGMAVRVAFVNKENDSRFMELVENVART